MHIHVFVGIDVFSAGRCNRSLKKRQFSNRFNRGKFYLSTTESAFSLCSGILVFISGRRRQILLFDFKVSIENDIENLHRNRYII